MFLFNKFIFAIYAKYQDVASSVCLHVMFLSLCCFLADSMDPKSGSENAAAGSSTSDQTVREGGLPSTTTQNPNSTRTRSGFPFKSLGSDEDAVKPLPEVELQPKVDRETGECNQKTIAVCGQGLNEAGDSAVENRVTTTTSEDGERGVCCDCGMPV